MNCSQLLNLGPMMYKKPSEIGPTKLKCLNNDI